MNKYSIIDTDVLIIGGGIGGCCTALKAKEHGLNVTIVEKAKTDRSGNASQGIDHVQTFLKDQITAEDAIGSYDAFLSDSRFGEGRVVNPNLTYRRWEKGMWMLDELEKVGVPIKWDDGQYYMIHTGIAYGERTFRVHWQNIKPILAAAVRKKKIDVLERTMVTDLCTNDDKVVGATAVNTRTGEFVVIRAKATVIATGSFARLYTCENPQSWKYKFRYHFCPSALAGDGIALAYRAGAEVVNMDLTAPHFRIRDDLTCSYGNFCIGDGLQAKTVNWKGEELPHAWVPISDYIEMEQKGLTPLYYHYGDHPEDYLKREEVAFYDERMVSLKIAEDRGFNPKTHWYEFGHNAPLGYQMTSGVATDGDFRSSLHGLYAVGNAISGYVGVGPAATAGFIVGDNIKEFVEQEKQPEIDENQVENLRQTALAPLAVKRGTEPMELESAVRYICERYAGNVKSEGKLNEGLRRLKSLKRVFIPKLMATNPHYLMRCLEAKNICELAELHLNASLSRKETRVTFIRSDYPEIDNSRNSMVTYQRLQDGNPVLEIKEVPTLDAKYAKGGK